jgi:hypothetical protein
MEASCKLEDAKRATSAESAFYISRVQMKNSFVEEARL